MTTLRPTTTLWRRTRTSLLAATFALGSVLAPIGASVLADSGSVANADGTSGASSFEWEGGSLSEATAIVSAGGGVLNLRADPSVDASPVAEVPHGAVIALRIDQVDTVVDPAGGTRWWPVSYAGVDGWASGHNLVDATGLQPGQQPYAFPGGDLEGVTVEVRAEAGLQLRDNPQVDARVIDSIPNGTIVPLRIDIKDSVADPDGVTRWWPVEFNDFEGWVSGYYIAVPGSAPSVTPVPDTTPEDANASSIFPVGSIALVQTPSGSGLALRSATGADAEQLGSLPERSEVTVLSGPQSFENSQNGWFEVRGEDGATGFVDGDLLVLISTPERQQLPTPTATTPSDDPEPSSTATSTPASSPTPTPEFNPDELDDEDDDPTPTDEADDPTPTSTETDPTPTPAGEESAQGFIAPVPGSTLTQNFGCSSLGFYPYNPDWGCGVHDGIDFAAPAYTPILAVADGEVVTAGWCDCGLGYYVEIDHGNGLHTLYGHMASQPYVSVGQRVSQGETIGPIGSTGLSTGPHTHFMVQINGVTQDPSRYLP